MGYVLQRMHGTKKQMISRLYEETLDEAKEYTSDVNNAIVFRDMSKAHKFLKHYKLHNFGFDIEFTMKAPNTHELNNIHRSQPFQV